MSRPTWDGTWADVARVIAQRSQCDRGQIGAVIVSVENKIVATGYNGPPARWKADSRLNTTCKSWCDRCIYGPKPATLTSYEDCPTIHAEMNALMHSSRPDREGGTLYVTGYPCFNCAKAVSNSGITTVVLVDADPAADAHRDPNRTVAMLKDSKVLVEYL